MVAIGMSLMPLKDIGKEIFLQVKGPFGLSKDLGPKRCLNIWKKVWSRKKQGNLWKWKKEMCIVINMMVVVQSNELEFQKLHEHHPF
jgi:hypothetical protein